MNYGYRLCCSAALVQAQASPRQAEIDCHTSSRLAEHAGELPYPRLSALSALRRVTSLTFLRLPKRSFLRSPGGYTARKQKLCACRQIAIELLPQCLHVCRWLLSCLLAIPLGLLHCFQVLSCENGGILKMLLLFGGDSRNTELSDFFFKLQFEKGFMHHCIKKGGGGLVYFIQGRNFSRP